MEKRYIRMLRGIGRKKRARGPKDWSVYVLRCAGGTLYTGIAKDVLARLRKHQSGKGAAYTRTHLPVELVYREDLMTRTEALIREALIKRLPKLKKEALISGRSGRPCARPRSRPAGRTSGAPRSKKQDTGPSLQRARIYQRSAPIAPALPALPWRSPAAS